MPRDAGRGVLGRPDTESPGSVGPCVVQVSSPRSDPSGDLQDSPAGEKQQAATPDLPIPVELLERLGPRAIEGDRFFFGDLLAGRFETPPSPRRTGTTPSWL